MTVFVRSYKAELSNSPVSEREVLRYMSSRDDEKTLALIRECLKSDICRADVCFAEYGIKHENDGVLDLGFARVKSKDLSKNLGSCERIVVFAATVGVELDRMIHKYSAVSPSRALCFDALGSERIEALCDIFCRELNEMYKKTRPRFSPGYGDLDIGLQRDIFASLNCPRRIGLSLGDGGLMSPSKSVTAIVGVGERIK